MSSASILARKRTMGMLDRLVQGHGDTLTILSDDPDSRVPVRPGQQTVRGSVGRSIVYGDHFEIPASLRLKTGQGLWQIFSPSRTGSKTLISGADIR